MAKIHTRAKRRKGITSTSRKHRFWFTNVEKKHGYRSFKSKEAAEKYAKENKMDTSKLRLHVLREDKIQWRPAE